MLHWVLQGVLVNFPQNISKGQGGEALSLADPSNIDCRSLSRIDQLSTKYARFSWNRNINSPNLQGSHTLLRQKRKQTVRIPGYQCEKFAGSDMSNADEEGN